MWGDASWEGREDLGLSCGPWAWEGSIKITGKECSRGAVQKWVGHSGAQRGLWEDVPEGSTPVLQEPGLPAGRAASLPGHTFLYCI